MNIVQGIFSPAIGLMNRLKYPGKFVVTGALAVISTTIRLASLTTNLYSAIRLARDELAATEIMLPIYRQIQLIQQHRDISAAVLSGATSMKNMLADKQIEVNAAVETVDTLESRHAALLGSNSLVIYVV